MEEKSAIQLDDDLGTDYPRHVVDWLDKYGISVSEALKHGWMYSPGRDQLVFIFREPDGEIVLTQARNFTGANKRKYFTQGSVAGVMPIFDSSLDSRQLVLVEDVLSAAKIARQCDAMPLLGSYLPKAKMSALKLFYERLVFWLDEDKLKEAMEMSTAARWLGFDTQVIYTELDPKEYSNEEIESYLCLSK